MRKFLIAILVLGSITGISACTSETPELKSPCVGIDGSPCDRRNPKDNVV